MNYMVGLISSQLIIKVILSWFLKNQKINKVA